MKDQKQPFKRYRLGDDDKPGHYEELVKDWSIVCVRKSIRMFEQLSNWPNLQYGQQLFYDALRWKLKTKQQT